RITADGAARLEAHLGSMRASLDDLPTFVESDLQFHLELAHTTGNSVLVDLLQIIRSLLRVWVDRAVEDVEHARTALAEHSAVMEAIRAGDGDAAASAMAAHMLTAGRRLTSLAS
ncbi:FCD domain-containing protein, partial [Schumannella luteola]